MGKLLNLLTMFGPLASAKFYVAVIMAIAMFVQVYAGIDLGLDEATVTAIVGGVGALLVWLVPNKKPKNTIPTYTEAEVRAKTGYQGPIRSR